ncbi:efflux RND transporter periplasmic adaptor subunit [Anabaena cylindrica FACHB-243]|uniref:Efflux transporter, RND family, MFP subunit n=1 Tax=Anabaena cylindrica (strain ATCC 27899 / PCC 7122) TaxID=272123 RepID=K9ZI93_ANACC|nr:MULTISPECIES: efflux RND transporter periplasmic adaptor subunit [Anabaena]AFZ58065.1 efflux transporter, RND family, MFP subunit [Anabaena cylindrica PCC 7122]MBD2419160.1 efflux RND transporter periplasmic adaptor subunit [Anabaena cylindrica FACHB-243]MBY5284019.1 efflux RND transporter periplasmic adaptor subunit [Anabaena sp. CCAP 1446/1C]MBY5306844.1 efflux RND transporter periplasmic adaptor subunit [Anabaena sp. CCAP 1446/1C]MCM2409632.1 efflux RND transporter periplasmic adaptor su
MILDGNKSEKQVKNPTSLVANPVMNGYSLFTFCLLGLLTASCGSLPKESAEAQSRQPGGRERGNNETAVDIAIAQTNLLSPSAEYIGNTTAFRIVSVRSQVEGRLLALNLDVGDTVQRGQIISQLDDVLLKTGLQQAEAELAARQSEVARAMTQVSNANAEVEKARLEVVQAKADSQRQQKLLKEGAISEQVAQQAQTKAQTAAQALQATIAQVRTEKQAVAAAQGIVFAQQAAVSAAKERRSYSRLISPITGIVTEKVTEPGNLLQPGNEVLKIGDFSRIKVVVQVSELELGKIQVGQSVKVRLDAFPETNIMGRVTRISPTADSTARLVPVEVVIPNSGGKIGSGLLARVNFTSGTPQRVVVSQTAITDSQRQTRQEENNGKLFVLDEKDGQPKVKERTVTLGKTANGKVEILSGLQPGESYVVRSSQPLKDGAVVKLSILSEK